jgi:hypothetical protein
VAGILLTATVGAELLDQGWHPVSTKHTNSPANVALWAIKWWRDKIDLRHERFDVKSARLSRAVPKTATKGLDPVVLATFKDRDEDKDR